MTTIDEDKKLILRVKTGDLGALGELYDRYNTDVYRTALAITCIESAAVEILQDCFLSLNRNIQSLTPSQPINSWLLRETVKLTFAWTKGHFHWPVSLDWQRQKQFSFPNPADTKEEQSQEVLIRAIAGLEFQIRVVVVLHYYHCLGIDEIAEILECPVGTVKSQLHYGRENLRRQLNKMNAFLPEPRGGHPIGIQEILLRNREI